MKEIKKLWFFAGWGKLSKKKRNTLLEFGVTDVVIGLNLNPKKFEFYNRAYIVADCKWLADNNITIHLMPWVNRNSEFLEKMFEDIQSVINQLDVECDVLISSVLLDVEKHWIKNTYKSSKFLSEEKALHDYILPFKTKLNNFDIKLGCTSFIRIPPSVQRLAQISDYVIPQAYSVYFPTKNKHWSHDLTFKPKISQEIAYNHWTDFNPNIVMGLACYYEARPGYTQIESLEQSLKATIDLGIEEIAYWDIKQCVGNGKKKEVRREFIKKIMNEEDHTLEFDKHDWITLQKALNEFHFNAGPLDGIPGSQTMAALELFRSKFDLKTGLSLNVKDLITLLDNCVF